MTKEVAVRLVAVALALTCMSGCGDRPDQEPKPDSAAAVADGSCPILADWSGQTYRGYSVQTELSRSWEIDPGAVLVDCLSSNSPTGEPLPTFRIKGIDPRTAFLIADYRGVVFLSVPPGQAPDVVRKALG